jgi:hypothetical protein
MATVILRNTVAQVQEPGAREWDAGEDEMFFLNGLQVTGYDRIGERVCLNLYRDMAGGEIALYLNLGKDDARVLANLLLRSIEEGVTR